MGGKFVNVINPHIADKNIQTIDIPPTPIYSPLIYWIKKLLDSSLSDNNNKFKFLYIISS